jgi:hypothetical protein
MHFIKALFTFFALTSLTHALPSPNKPPTTTIAGITVPNTHLIIASQAYARAHGDNMTYNHIMRTWLFGANAINKNATLSNTIDSEAFAVAALLHDLGWENSTNSTIVSTDKRFEVDGANAARAFIEQHGSKNAWDDNRKQLVWDAIALHATQSISMYKQAECALVTAGVFADISGPDGDPTGSLTWEEYDRIKAEFPRLDVGARVTDIICGFARTKPASTYGE